MAWMRFIKTDDFTDRTARCIETIQGCNPKGKWLMFALAPKSIFWPAPKTGQGRASIAARHFRVYASCIALAQRDKLPRIAQALASKAAAKLRFVVFWKEAI
ncbi:hypothetical protein [Mesorhizobium sp. ORM16]|uniref:hypothetical protein n=1 Tax=Mesorhizobium sp. ORM16 TaxID=3376989 RepID=UPI003857F1A4